MSDTNITNVVKEKYGQAALRVTAGGSSRCGATAADGLNWGIVFAVRRARENVSACLSF